MAMESDLFAGLVSEDVGRFGGKNIVADQIADRPTGFESRIQREPRFWPEQTVGDLLLDLAADLVVFDLQEALDEVLVVAQDLVQDTERVHAAPPSACVKHQTRLTLLCEADSEGGLSRLSAMYPPALEGLDHLEFAKTVDPTAEDVSQFVERIARVTETGLSELLAGHSSGRLCNCRALHVDAHDAKRAPGR